MTERTVRRDITRLRDLGYPVEATTGPYGGYTLGRRRVGFRRSCSTTTKPSRWRSGCGPRRRAPTGTESAALSALAKLDQVLPVQAARAGRGDAPRSPSACGRAGVPAVDVDALVAAGVACRRPERLRFTYSTRPIARPSGPVEPFRLVYTERSWYLVAFDPIPRRLAHVPVDRMSELHLTGQRFVARRRPARRRRAGVAGVAVSVYDLQVQVRLPLPVDRGPGAGLADGRRRRGRVRPRPAWSGSGATPTGSPATLAGLECRVEVVDGDEVKAELRALGRRLVREHR